MFEGYLELGGNEVLNSARALGYTQTAACQINWLTCPPCDGVQDALGDGPYDIDTITSAPWYDATDEPTHRFYGAHAILIEGIQDSTRTADVAEGITDGGVVGQVRYGTKRIRVRAMLSARGKDALAAGFSWLDAVLRPGTCGTHGSTCGASDAGFYAACPPTRFSITSPIGYMWSPTAFNLLRRPRPQPDQWELTGLTGAVVDDYAQLTVNAAGAAYADLTGEHTRVSANHQPVTYQAEVRLGATTAAAVLRLLWMDAGGAYIPVGTQDGIPTMSKDWTRIAVTGSPPPGAAYVGAFLLLATDQPIGATVDVRHLMAERGRNISPWFDGDTESTDEQIRYVWRGDENDSISVREIGALELAPDEIIYNRVVGGLQRTLHNVTCVSGPTIEETLNRGEAWGYIVEFVLVAATPWIFSNPRQIDLPPTLPVVVQDLLFNLAPYPSAELSSGAVVIATNLTANPSVETDASNWIARWSGTPSGDISGARSTIAASVGDAAFRSHLVATGSGTNAAIYCENASTTFPAVVAGVRMSVNMWAAATVASGTAVIQKIEVFALWRAGTTDVRTDLIGTVPVAGGGSVSKHGIAPPVGATNVLVHAIATLTSWSAGAVVDVYGDAVAVTAP